MRLGRETFPVQPGVGSSEFRAGLVFGRRNGLHGPSGAGLDGSCTHHCAAEFRCELDEKFEAFVNAGC
jgi:hypothetical protein